METNLNPELFQHFWYNKFLIGMAIFSFIWYDHVFYKVFNHDHKKYDADIQAAIFGTVLACISFGISGICNIWIPVQVLLILILGCIATSFYFETIEP